jgi:hypothetical protein
MYANDFAVQDGILRVHLIGHGEEPPKSDAFLLEYNGAYVLIDGGLTDCDVSLRYLLEVRRALLGDAADSDCRLKIRVMISHCHGDHVGALITHVLPSPLIEVEEIYMPPNAGLDERFGLNGDIKFRPDLQRAIATYQPNARVTDLTFGTENRVTLPMTADAEAPIITLCPPWCNSGSPERVRLLCETLKHGEENPNIPTLIVNNNSVWMHVRHGKRTFLFTGDTVKKNKPMGYEMLEEMIAAYADVLGQVDVVKFVHHGYKRDAAVDAIMSLSPRYVFVTTCLATADRYLHEKYPESDVQTRNCGIDTYIFQSDGEQLAVTPFM